MARTRPRLTEARGLLWREGSGSVLSRDGASGGRRKAVPDTRKESCLWSGHISPPHLLQGGESVGGRELQTWPGGWGQNPLDSQSCRELTLRLLSAGFCKGFLVGESCCGGEGKSASALWEGGCVFIDLAVWVQGSLHGLSGPPGQASSSEPSHPCWPAASSSQTTVSIMLNRSRFLLPQMVSPSNSCSPGTCTCGLPPEPGFCRCDSDEAMLDAPRLSPTWQFSA